MENSQKEAISNEEEVWNKMDLYLETKIPVHFCFYREGPRRGAFKNGIVIALHRRSMTFILQEFIDGKIMISCKDVYAPSIQPYEGEHSIIASNKKEVHNGD